MLFKHNFSPHNVSLWNNHCILFQRKSWWQRGIWSVLHIMHKNGCFFSYNDFCTKFNFKCEEKVYLKVIKSIPLPFLNMLKRILTHSTIIAKILDLKLGKVNFADEKCINKFIRNCLMQESYPGPIRRNYIFQHLNRKLVNEFRCKYLLFPLPPKYKEVDFKILYDIYPAKEFLRLRFNMDCNNMSIL